ncbi:hypothetical protein EV700_2624 [Fluviicoccus keumensis]|uniref:Uncharacterized protein n=1 Tax=Fluviicoccus keumensis TaxID=1435465 RepID=A0A4Q7YPN1_9GAMM|nr:hypothetical protein [Fluviicoccus keumensis]RZU38689.1 hypothetical protein EV700_2624 [Fluviicoccus keumensis]
MYSAGKEVLEQGLSLFSRILLGVVAGLFGVGMIFMGHAAKAPWFFYVFGSFCLFITVACITTGKVRVFFGRLIGALVFMAAAWYLVSELSSGPIISGMDADPSILNAAKFFILAGIPGLGYALFARFSPRESDK